MSIGRYLEGVLLGLICLAPLAVGARRLRKRIAPGYDGVVAWVADGAGLVALLTVALEVVGVLDLLDTPGVVAGCVLTGLAAVLLAGRGGPGRRSDITPIAPAAETGPARIAGRNRRLVISVAMAGSAVVGAAWLGWTIFAYRHGMQTADTLWYHLPTAARFVQLHSIRHLQYFDGDAITVFYPANAELLHVFGLVIFGNDLLSPALDLLWGAAALCCAWAIGRPWGREPHCLLACLPVLLSPGLVDTQPGGGYNDVVCLALILACIALLVNAAPGGDGRLDGRLSLLAALPAGLALGTKFTMILPVLAIGLGCQLIVARARLWRHLGGWITALALLGGYWYLRNWIAVGNPLPALSHIGPFSLPAPHTSRSYTVWQYLGNGAVWRQWLIPGLRRSLGLAWWALLAGFGIGALTAIAQRRDAGLRVVGAVALLAGFVFLITPQLLGIPGAPIFFLDNVRYCAAPLAVGLVLVPLGRPLHGRRASLTWLTAAALAVVFTGLDPGVWRSGFPVAPFAPPVHGGPALAGAVLAGGALVAAELWVWRERLGIPRVPVRGRPGRVVLTVSGALVLVLAGIAVGKQYASDRYRNASPFPAIYAWAQHLQSARIGLIGLPLQYPLAGPDSANWVQYIGVSRPQRGYAPPATCRQWRAAVNRGHYTYVVVTAPFISSDASQPELGWTRTSPHALAIVHERLGAIELAVVYRITGVLAPNSCPA